jgi:hypothetical protein
VIRVRQWDFSSDDLLVAAIWTRAEWLYQKARCPFHWDSVGLVVRLEWFERAAEHMGISL